MELSQNHPLLTDPLKPWPYKVLVGYRRPGNRAITASRAIYIRASGEDEARLAGIRKAREMLPMVVNGERLVASRVVSSRPLDKCDAIGAGV